jgi:hypothetical protein
LKKSLQEIFSHFKNIKLNRKRLTILLFISGFILVGFILLRYFDLRENFYREYLKHKEIMFLLSNYENKQKINLNEEFIKSVFSKYSVEITSFNQVSQGIEIKGKNLSGAVLPELFFMLEDAGAEIVKFKLIDNTGSGIFDYEIILR